MNQVIPTTVFTIIGGVSIFVLGQIFLKAFMEPILKLRPFKGTIVDSLVYYCNVYSNPGLNKEDDQKASKNLRKLASELMSKTTVIPCYRFWSFLRVVPRFSDIRGTHRNLIGLSNGVFSTGDAGYNTECVEKIKIALRLPKELLR